MKSLSKEFNSGTLKKIIDLKEGEILHIFVKDKNGFVCRKKIKCIEVFRE